MCVLYKDYSTQKCMGGQQYFLPHHPGFYFHLTQSFQMYYNVSTEINILVSKSPIHFSQIAVKLIGTN